MPVPRSPFAIAIASLLLPGGGHWLAGSRRAVRWIAPPLVVLAIALAWTAILSPTGVVAAMLLAPVALTVTGLVLAFGTWHVLSVLAAVRLNAHRGADRAALAFHGLLVILLLIPYGWAGSVTWAVYEADSAVFAAAGTDYLPRDFSVPSGDPVPEVIDPSEPPVAQAPLPINDDLTVLVIGSDDFASRECCGLTDTLMVLNYDADSNGLSLLSVPRDISSFPLSSGGVYTGKINSLLAFAQQNPELFEASNPHQVLLREIGHLVGVQIDHYVLIDVDGALEVANALGGVTVNNPSPINDTAYRGPDGSRGFKLSAGEHHLTGLDLIAFVRSRQSPGDTDFTRAARQQEVVSSLWRELLSPNGVARLPDLLPAVARNVRTDMSPSDAGELLRSLASEGRGDVERVVLGEPYTFHPPTSETGGAWELRLNLDKLSELSQRLYGEASRYKAD